MTIKLTDITPHTVGAPARSEIGTKMTSMTATGTNASMNRLNGVVLMILFGRMSDIPIS